MPKTKKQSKKSKVLNWLKPTSTAKGMLLFAIAFAIIGGSYMVFKSFAFRPDSGDHICAVKRDSTVWCWGGGKDGELGNGLFTNSLRPVQVKNMKGAVQVGFGDDHSCALKLDGTVWCWGNNDYGELGTGTYTSTGLPVQVKNSAGTGPLTGVIQLSSTSYYNCALKTDKTVWCWGYNTYGQLGTGSRINSTLPVSVLSTTGTGKLSSIKSVATALTHACAVKIDSGLVCWGSNFYGELGNGIHRDLQSPVTAYINNVTQVVVNDLATCALKTDKTVWCWGGNMSGQLGNNTYGDSTVIAPVKSISGTGKLTEVVQISSYSNHVCALRTDTTLRCWGNNRNGELGYGQMYDVDIPVPVIVKGIGGVGNLTNVKQVNALFSNTCARLIDNSLYCWGNNDYGQFGNGTITDGKPSPVKSLFTY